MSLKAGGVGINLTAASNAFLLVCHLLLSRMQSNDAIKQKDFLFVKINFKTIFSILEYDAER